MRTAPAIWTHHHTRRLYHTSMVTIWAFITLVSLWGASLSLWRVQADSPVGITATVGLVSPGPSEPISSGGGSGSVPSVEPPVAVPSTPEVVAPEIVFKLPQDVPARTVVSSDGVSRNAQVYATQYPRFAGNVGISRAVIFIEVHSDYVIRSTTVADEAGNWSWEPDVAIPPGLHEARITVKDASGTAALMTSSVWFIVEISAIAQVVPTIPALRLPSGGIVASAIDVVLTVPEAYREVTPGEQMVTNVKFIRNVHSLEPINVPVKYRIQDRDGKTIMDVDEVVEFINQLSILKTFYTASNLPAGNYKLTAIVPSEKFSASSSEIFSVLDPAVAASTTDASNNNWLMFQVLGAFTLLFLMITYFEYRRVLTINNRIKQIDASDLAFIK